MNYITFRNERISALGLGTTGFWSGHNSGLASNIAIAHEEYGINLFDTAEMYGDGKCETALAKAIKGMDRSSLFLVDKIHPDNANEHNFDKSLDLSLERLQTDYIDLYLLHWRECVDLPFLVDAMHKAQESGKIRYWGVSNFDIHDLKDLFRAGGKDCFCNQVFYTLYERGCEYDLVPFMKENDILPMSYSSLGSSYHPHPDIHTYTGIMEACQKYKVSPEAYMLRMNVEAGFAALFSTSSSMHLHRNLQELSETEYQALKLVFDQTFPPPTQAVKLAKI